VATARGGRSDASSTFPCTITVHFHHIYQKLAIQNQTALAALASRDSARPDAPSAGRLAPCVHATKRDNENLFAHFICYDQAYAWLVVLATLFQFANASKCKFEAQAALVGRKCRKVVPRRVPPTGWKVIARQIRISSVQCPSFLAVPDTNLHKRCCSR